jgi:hypothetical protein
MMKEQDKDPERASPRLINYCPNWERLRPSDALALKTLRGQHEQPKEDSDDTTSNLECYMQRVAEAIGDDNAARILEIAQRDGLSGEQRMKLIVQLDNRFNGKNSEQWGKLLGVSAAAVRGYPYWQELHEKKERD